MCIWQNDRHTLLFWTISAYIAAQYNEDIVLMLTLKTISSLNLKTSHSTLFGHLLTSHFALWLNDVINTADLDEIQVRTLVLRQADSPQVIKSSTTAAGWENGWGIILNWYIKKDVLDKGRVENMLSFNLSGQQLHETVHHMESLKSLRIRWIQPLMRCSTLS